MFRLLTFSLSALISVSVFAAPAPNPSVHQLREWMKEAFAAAKQVPVEARLELAQRGSSSSSRVERIKAALLTIALRPQYFGPYRLVSAMELPHDLKEGLVTPEQHAEFKAQAAVDRAAAEAFIEELYGAHAGTSDEEALNWAHGLAEFRLTMWRWKDALPLIREVTQFDRDGYTLTMLAVIEKLNGNDEPYAKIAANCPEKHERFGDGLCVVVARSLANRMRAVGYGKLPPEMEEILAGKASPRMNWSERMHDLYTLARSNRDAAKKALREVLATPDAPDWAQDDAVFTLARIAFDQQEWAHSIQLTDCWMTRVGLEFPPVTADVWQEIPSTERDDADGYIAPDADGESCLQHDDKARQRPGLASPCISDLLMMRVVAAGNARDVAAAKLAAEQTAAIVAGTGAGVRNLSRLLWFAARAIAAGRPHSAESDAVLQYLATIRDAEQLPGEVEAAVRRQTGRVIQPWASPTIVSPAPCPTH